MTRILLLMALALGGCGARQRLRPPPGEPLPPKPATAAVQPTANELLAQPATARPARTDEVLTRSQPRGDDRFDLPPH